MCAYFASEVENNQVVRNIFEGQLLAQIDVRLQGQELKIDQIIWALRSIAPPLPDEPIYLYRGQILEELYGVYIDHGPNNYVYADELNSWKAARSAGNDQLWTTALSQLAAEGFILAHAPGNDRRAVVAVNPERLQEVQRIVLLQKHKMGTGFF